MPGHQPECATVSQHLPLPLAQLYDDAWAAKTPLEHFLNAFYLWEAGLKLLAVSTLLEYQTTPARHAEPVPGALKALSRPSLGHWRAVVRAIIPVVARHNPARFGGIAELMVKGDQLPETANLYRALVPTAEEDVPK